MTAPASNLIQVQRYLDANLGMFVNQSCAFDPRISNMKFKNFENEVGQLGASVLIEKPFRARAGDGLVITEQGVEMRSQTLVTDKAKHVARAFNTEDFVYTVEQYMDKIGMSAMRELGSVVEADVFSGLLSSGYRFYGDGNTAFNSPNQMALALAYFRDYGSVNSDFVGIIDGITEASLIGGGATQFALNRNNEELNSWELGPFSGCNWFRSNELPIHTAGTCGQNGTQITFASINAAGDEITFSGAGTETGFFKEGDLLWFDTNVKFLKFVGHTPSQSDVQVRITEDADSSGGNVTAKIYPALKYDATGFDTEANLSRALTTSDTAKVANSHRRAVIMSGKPLMIAMPKLPDESPYVTAYATDNETGVSLRMYQGAKYGQNSRGMVHDVLYGYEFIHEQIFFLCIPL